MPKVQIEVEIDEKYVTLSAPGCADCIAKVSDEGAVGSHVLELARKAQPKVNGEAKRDAASDDEYEGPEPTLVEALGDIASIPEVQKGVKSILGFLGSISTPRKEE